MKKAAPFESGITLVELMVSVTVLFLLMGMVAWLAKGSSDHRIRSERKLKLLTQLQRDMFLIENDLLSARRHTLGNVLCNNVIYNFLGDYYMTSDPGFDVDYTSLTTDISVRDAWYSASLPLIPVGVGPTIHAEAYIDRSPGNRLHGTGSLAIRSSLPDTNVSVVRSPDFGELQDQNYVLAGWVKGDSDGAAGRLIPQIVLQTNAGNGLPGGSDIVVTPAPAPAELSQWKYVTIPLLATGINTLFTYNVYLRATRDGATTRTLTAFFDDITLTPAVNIAQINFSASRTGSATPNVNLYNRTDLGMVFYQTDPVTGSLMEMKYIFADKNQRTFPVVVPDLLRYSSPFPYRSPLGGGVSWPGYPSFPPPRRLELPLTNIDSINVSWVGDASSGTYRSILVTTTVRDRADASKTLTLSRTLYPPTD